MYVNLPIRIVLRPKVTLPAILPDTVYQGASFVSIGAEFSGSLFTASMSAICDFGIDGQATCTEEEIETILTENISGLLQIAVVILPLF